MHCPDEYSVNTMLKENYSVIQSHLYYYFFLIVCQRFNSECQRNKAFTHNSLQSEQSLYCYIIVLKEPMHLFSLCFQNMSMFSKNPLYADCKSS